MLTPERITENTGYRCEHSARLPELRTCPACKRKVLHACVVLKGALFTEIWVPLPHCPDCGDQSEKVISSNCRGYQTRAGHKCAAKPESPKGKRGEKGGAR